MDDKFIGRQKEQIILKDALQSSESEMIAVIGRRRVGKTFLIRSVYDKKIDIEFTGVQNATRTKAFSVPMIYEGRLNPEKFCPPVRLADHNG